MRERRQGPPRSSSSSLPFDRRRGEEREEEVAASSAEGSGNEPFTGKGGSSVRGIPRRCRRRRWSRTTTLTMTSLVAALLRATTAATTLPIRFEARRRAGAVGCGAAETGLLASGRRGPCAFFFAFVVPPAPRTERFGGARERGGEGECGGSGGGSRRSLRRRRRLGWKSDVVGIELPLTTRGRTTFRGGMRRFATRPLASNAFDDDDNDEDGRGGRGSGEGRIRRLAEFDDVIFEASSAAAPSSPRPFDDELEDVREEEAGRPFGAYEQMPEEENSLLPARTAYFYADDKLGGESSASAAEQLKQRREAPPPAVEYDYASIDDDGSFGEASFGYVGAREDDAPPPDESVAALDDFPSVFVRDDDATGDERTVAAAPTTTNLGDSSNLQRTDRGSLLAKSSDGNGVLTEIQRLEIRLSKITSDIYAQNDNVPFNVNSLVQVSDALFGSSSSSDDSDSDGSKVKVKFRSTNKSVLEGMASAGNRMADLILQYRTCKRRLDAERRREINIAEDDVSRPRVGASRRPRDRDPLLLIDASAYVFRAYHSMPPLHAEDGTPVGAVLGFCNMLNRLVLRRLLSDDESELPLVVLVFDSEGGSAHRRELYPEYKAHRKPCPIDLVPQFDLVKDAADAYGITRAEAKGHEADDVIATLATMAVEGGISVEVLTGDKDLMQLVTEDDDDGPSVRVVDPMSAARITSDAVKRKWGVSPSKLGDVLALAGDASDNIPGIPMIGPKIAAKLVDEYGTLEELLERAHEVTQPKRRENLLEYADAARLSRRLVELERRIPIENMTMLPTRHDRVEEFRVEPLDDDGGRRLLSFYDRLGLRDLKSRVQARLDQRNRSRLVRTTTTPVVRDESGYGRGAGAEEGGTIKAIDAEDEEGEAEASFSAVRTNETTDASRTNETTDASRRRNDNDLRSYRKEKAVATVPKPEDFDDVPF